MTEPEPQPPIVHVLSFILMLSLVLICIFLFLYNPLNVPRLTPTPADQHLTYNDSHLVLLTFYPEKPGMTIVASPEALPYPELLSATFGVTPALLELPTIVGITDNSSRVALPLSPVYRYNISVGGECTFQIFPLDSAYSVFCNT